MKEKIKIASYIFLLALALGLFYYAQTLLQEREALREQQSSLQQELAQVQQFALAHKDYDAYSEKQRREIATLEREFAKRSSSADCLKVVQRLAAAQGVRMLSVQTQGIADVSEAKNNGAAKGGATLRITAAGNFFDILRWLRKLEREGVCISNLIMKQEKIQGLNVEVLIKL